MSLSRVVEYLCLASTGPSRIDRSTPNRALEREYRPKRHAKAIGELILPRLGVLACVLGFCSHGLISFASIAYQVASSGFALLSF